MPSVPQPFEVLNLPKTLHNWKVSITWNLNSVAEYQEKANFQEPVLKAFVRSGLFRPIFMLLNILLTDIFLSRVSFVGNIVEPGRKKFSF